MKIFGGHKRNKYLVATTQRQIFAESLYNAERVGGALNTTLFSYNQLGGCLVIRGANKQLATCTLQVYHLLMWLSPQELLGDPHPR